MRRIHIAAAALLSLLFAPLLAQAADGGGKTTSTITPAIDCRNSSAAANPFAPCIKGARTSTVATAAPALAPAPAPAPVPVPVPVTPPVSSPPAKSVPNAAPPAPPTTGYTKCAEYGQLCRVSVPSMMIWGKGNTFTTAKVTDKDTWCNGSLGTDFRDTTSTACWIQPVGAAHDTTGSAMPPSGLPINTSALPQGSKGSDRFLVAPTAERPWDSEGGAFRIVCDFAKMARIDPIVYPGTVNQSHLHTFFGNVAVNENSTPESLLAFGNSTCRGGIANRSAYWVPTMIDSATGEPVVPDGISVYYKSGFVSGDKLTRGIPGGLRMVAGNPTATAPLKSTDVISYRYKCIGGPRDQNDKYGSAIPNCDLGASVWQEVFFPQCWDGVNFDSPDHKSHMSYPVSVNDPASSKGWQKLVCPASHPVILPQITFNVVYTAKTADAALRWRLASDNYGTTQPGGYSAHADWFNGWRQDVSDAWFQNCLVANKDCHSHLLGDWRMIY